MSKFRISDKSVAGRDFRSEIFVQLPCGEFDTGIFRALNEVLLVRDGFLCLSGSSFIVSFVESGQIVMTAYFFFFWVF